MARYDELPVSENLILEASVPDKVEMMAQRNGCGDEPASSPHDDGVTMWTYGCPASGPVVLYEVADGRHSWDLGTGLDTTALLWSFFENQAP